MHEPKGRLRLFRVRGVDVCVDASFAAVALFFVWLLATGFFPESYPELGGSTTWWMALAGVAGLALSVVAQEVAHAFAAARAGVAVHSVSLFLLGGVAEMADEPRSWKDEIVLAVAGPLVGALLAVSFLVLASVGTLVGAPVPVTAVLTYLGWLNLLLAAFNLLPAFPLDGGRIVRALLMRKGYSRAWATELAAGFGKGFGVLFIVIGVLSIFFDGVVTGVWWAAIGVFLRRASRRATSTVVARAALEGEPLARFVRPVRVTAAPAMSLERFLKDVVYGARVRVAPVVEGDRLVGTASARDLGRVGRGRFGTLTVASIVVPPGAARAPVIEAERDAAEALAAMGAARQDRVFVVADGALRGEVLARDLLDFVALKLEVDGPVTDASRDDALLRAPSLPPALRPA